MKLITKDGKKLYPLCGWERCEHIIDTYYTSCLNDRDDAFFEDRLDDYERLDKKCDRVSYLYDVFEANVYDNIVYAPYPEYGELKNIITGYDVRHN